MKIAMFFMLLCAFIVLSCQLPEVHKYEITITGDPIQQIWIKWENKKNTFLNNVPSPYTTTMEIPYEEMIWRISGINLSVLIKDNGVLVVEESGSYVVWSTF